MKSVLFKILSAFFLSVMLVSCASDKTEQDPSDEELYHTAQNALEKGSYKKAVENFQEIERLYPFSKLAQKSQIIAAYSLYKDEEYGDAIAIIDNFVKVNPAYKDIAYAYYLKAICYYDQIADVKRDQNNTEQALIALQEVVRRFPDNEYGRDAKLKIDLVKDHLAGKEMEVGRFYLKQAKYIAALNRFKEVVNNYQTTSHIEEALYRLVETYTLLGLPDEAKKNAAVLGSNYPDSKWYKYSYKIVGGETPKDSNEKKSWLSGIIPSFGKSSSGGGLTKENKTDSILK